MDHLKNKFKVTISDFAQVESVVDRLNELNDTAVEQVYSTMMFNENDKRVGKKLLRTFNWVKNPDGIFGYDGIRVDRETNVRYWNAFFRQYFEFDARSRFNRFSIVTYGNGMIMIRFDRNHLDSGYKTTCKAVLLFDDLADATIFKLQQ
jgi:hypothetical protein